MPAGFHCMAGRSLHSNRWHLYSGLLKGCSRLWRVWEINTSHQPNSVIVWLWSACVIQPYLEVISQCWDILSHKMFFWLEQHSDSVVSSAASQQEGPIRVPVFFVWGLNVHLLSLWVLMSRCSRFLPFLKTKQHFGGLKTANSPQMWICVTPSNDGLASHKLFPHLAIYLEQFQLLVILTGQIVHVASKFLVTMIHTNGPKGRNLSSLVR